MVENSFEKAEEYFLSKNFIMAKDCLLWLFENNKIDQAKTEKAYLYLLEIYKSQNDKENIYRIESHLLSYWNEQQDIDSLKELLKNLLDKNDFSYHKEPDLLRLAIKFYDQSGEIEISKNYLKRLITFLLKRKNFPRLEEVWKYCADKNIFLKEVGLWELEAKIFKGNRVETAEYFNSILRKTEFTQKKLKRKEIHYSIDEVMSFLERYRASLTRNPQALSLILFDDLDKAQANINRDFVNKFKYSLIEGILTNPDDSHLILLAAHFFREIGLIKESQETFQIFKGMNTNIEKSIYEKYAETLEKYNWDESNLTNSDISKTNFWEKSSVTKVLKNLKGVSDLISETENNLSEEQEVERNIQFLLSIEENERAAKLAMRLKEINPDSKWVKYFFSKGTSTKSINKTKIYTKLLTQLKDFSVKRFPEIEINNTKNSQRKLGQELNLEEKKLEKLFLSSESFFQSEGLSLDEVIVLNIQFGFYLNAIKKLEAKLAELRKVKNFKREVEIVYLLANCYFESKDYQKCLNLLSPYLEFSPLNDQEKISLLYYQGEAYYKLRDYTRAKNSYLEIKKIDDGYRNIQLRIDSIEKS